MSSSSTSNFQCSPEHYVTVSIELLVPVAGVPLAPVLLKQLWTNIQMELHGVAALGASMQAPENLSMEHMAALVAEAQVGFHSFHFFIHFPRPLCFLVDFNSFFFLVFASMCFCTSMALIISSSRSLRGARAGTRPATWAGATKVVSKRKEKKKSEKKQKKKKKGGVSTMKSFTRRRKSARREEI
jgi:hypothetical protein